MKPQKGCISIDRGNWCLRWRETETVDGQDKRKLRFKILAPVTAEHLKSKDRKTGKPRIPAEVQSLANAIMGVANGDTQARSILGIAQAIKDQSGIAGNTSALKVADAILEVVNSPVQESAVLTIGELVEQRFFPDVEKTLKLASIENYKFVWNRYLKARLARRIVREFERSDAHKLWCQIHEAYPHLRRRSLVQIKSVVNSVFKWALDRGLYYGTNPAQATLPAGLRENKVTEAYSIDEVRAILKVCIAPKLAAVVALFFGSGLRRGEVAGLCWEHYERLDDGAVLHIKQAAYRGRIQSPKTKQSIGDINLGESFCRYIDAYRATLPAGSDSGLMFTGRFVNRPMQLDTYVRAELFPVLKAAGIPWRGGFHAFRRGNSTFVARALNSEAAAAHSRHTVEIAEQSYIKASDQERRGSRAAAVASIADKRAELRRAAANTLSAGMEASERVN